MTKGVVQYLRGLDISGVEFDPSLLSGPDSNRAAANDQAVDEEPAQSVHFWPSTDILANMSRLQWLKLHEVGLKDGCIPKELSQLTHLENLSLIRNSLTHLSAIKNWSEALPALRSINCRKNKLSGRDAIPTDLFECPNLQVVDFSCNNLSAVPAGVENAKHLLVLNLSENCITSVPSDLFINCKELTLLDLTHNRLETLPAQVRRCTSLQQLLLSHNPLTHAQLRSVTSLRQLQVLHLANTERRLENIPSELDHLKQLVELDLSHNHLTRIPKPVLSFHSLRKLNLSHNEMGDLAQLTGDFPHLQYFNVSYNKLTHLPTGLTRLTHLRKLYVNNNQLIFTGIPSGIGKIEDLEVFDASYNELESIPESICRCGRLKRLILTANRLLTLPDAIHYLKEALELFNVDQNPNLRFPPKPQKSQKGAGLAYYNIDFSLEGQLRQMCGRPPPEETTSQAKDTASRMSRLRRRRAPEGDGSQCVLEGMQRIAQEKDELLRKRELEVEEETSRLAVRRWQDQLSKPQLDYTGIFSEDTGTVESIEIWEIDEFYPKRVDDEVSQGKLFDGDCYIVLQSKRDENLTLDWTIYYWIGSQASMDKQTCSAIHAVNLRNFLGAEGRTHREEQDDESPEFKALFKGNLMVLPGSHGETGFLHVQEDAVVVNMYRLFGTEKRMLIVSMPLSPHCLDPKFCYLVDACSQIFLWLGADSRLMVRTKGRLLAEKISVRERRNEATIHLEHQGRESNTFWAVVTGVWQPPPLASLVEVAEKNDEVKQPLAVVGKAGRREATLTADASAFSPWRVQPSAQPVPQVERPLNVPRDFILADWKLPRPILYDVHMGKGYLELPQAELAEGGVLSKQLLDSKHVYLLDSGGELFVWVGEKSTRFLRFAGYKLAQELASSLMPRGCFGGAPSLDSLRPPAPGDGESQQQWTTRPPPQLCTQGAESQIFRAQFSDWEEAIAVDFTRATESVARRGVDMLAILEKNKPTTDLRPLLAPREGAMGWNEALQLMYECNEELVNPPSPDELVSTPALKQFTNVDGKWVPVDGRWFGHFFNKDAYVLIARYWDFDEDLSQDENPGEGTGQADEDALSTDRQQRTKSVVYFWQGREASDLLWLVFNFSVRKDMEVRLSKNPCDDGRPLKVEFKRIRQQQEDLFFLAHFQRQLVIHSGHYRDRVEAPVDEQAIQLRNKAQMYYVRANGNPIFTRTIEVSPSATHLNSCFSYIVRAPVVDEEALQHVWLWVGKKSNPGDAELLQQLGGRIYDPSVTEFELLHEGTESDAFFAAIGGRRKYDESADFLTYGRLFRLSNDQGYFCASEKCSDFCQEDLADDDVMMLDTGDQIYLWWGKHTSDVEQKLSLQAAKMYHKHLATKQPNRPRGLKLTLKNVEPHRFRRCFHAWGPFREPKDWSG